MYASRLRSKRTPHHDPSWIQSLDASGLRPGGALKPLGWEGKSHDPPPPVTASAGLSDRKIDGAASAATTTAKMTSASMRGDARRTRRHKEAVVRCQREPAVCAPWRCVGAPLGTWA